MFKCKRALLAAASALFVVGSGLTGAQANTLNVFENGPAPGLDIDLAVNVAGGIASFTFKNNSTGGAVGADVHEIYFENGLAPLLTAPIQINALGSIGATYEAGVAPPDPPGGNNQNWGGTFQGFDATGGGLDWLSAGDTWVVTFALVNAATTAGDILAAIFNQNGTSRIAMHIGDCTNTSCSAFFAPDGDNQNPLPTPLPGALLLMGTVLAGGVSIAKWRRRRAQVAG